MPIAARINDRIPDLGVALSRLLDQIPRGKVTTYGRLANALGDRIASRWVGEYLRDHPHNKTCHCHRVLRADGSLGIYVPGGVADKAERLRADNVQVAQSRVHLERYLFDTFETESPLAHLRQWQTELASRVRLTAPARPMRWIGGVDVSYGPTTSANSRWGTAAYVVYDRNVRQVVFQTTIRAPVRFPYVSTYLSFRELPLLAEALQAGQQQFPQQVDVILVDGSGVLHPRQSGVAAILGVVMDMPTIGVTKKWLCGQYDRTDLANDAEAAVVIGGQQLGDAILPASMSGTVKAKGTGSSKPIFVSPGHRIDRRSARDVVRATIRDHRLPEPIYWADRLSRNAV